MTTTPLVLVTANFQVQPPLDTAPQLTVAWATAPVPAALPTFQPEAPAPTTHNQYDFDVPTE